jgi:hypothetical protein
MASSDTRPGQTQEQRRVEMPLLKLKKDFDVSSLETGSLCLGYAEIRLLFNVGPFPGGGDCVLVAADGKHTYVNSNDLIHDLEAYEILEE